VTPALGSQLLTVAEFVAVKSHSKSFKLAVLTVTLVHELSAVVTEATAALTATRVVLKVTDN
jgi:Na+/H+ antiporter NhaD/arsenite permease-like protein